MFPVASALSPVSALDPPDPPRPPPNEPRTSPCPFIGHGLPTVGHCREGSTRSMNRAENSCVDVYGRLAKGAAGPAVDSYVHSTLSVCNISMRTRPKQPPPKLHLLTTMPPHSPMAAHFSGKLTSQVRRVLPAYLALVFLFLFFTNTHVFKTVRPLATPCLRHANFHPAHPCCLQIPTGAQVPTAFAALHHSHPPENMANLEDWPTGFRAARLRFCQNRTCT